MSVSNLVIDRVFCYSIFLSFVVKYYLENFVCRKKNFVVVKGRLNCVRYVLCKCPCSVMNESTTRSIRTKNNAIVQLSALSSINMSAGEIHALY